MQTCYTPCTAWDCDAPRPSYDQFVRWGQGVAMAGLSGREYLANAAAIAQTAMVNNALAGVVGGGAVAMQVGALFLATAAAVTVITPGATLVTVGAALSLAIPAAALAGVLAAIAGVVMLSMRLNDELSLPGRLASLVVGARDSAYDSTALLKSDDDVTTLFSLFTAATLPVPSLGRQCDNSLIPVRNYGDDAADEVFFWDPETGRPVSVKTTPCLNPTPVPETSPADPHFVIRSLATGQVTSSPTVSLKVRDDTADVRVSDEWLVVKGSNTPQVQALSVNFTGWDGRARTASVTRTPGGVYAFSGLTADGLVKGVDPGTCEAERTCWSGQELHYIGADGTKYRAILAGPVIGSPTHSVEPTVNHPVTFDAGGFRTHGTTVPFYEWRFQTPGCATPCTSPVVGETATFTWREPGTYQVQLSARSFGDWPSMVKTFEVEVQSGSPPRLTVDPDCETTADMECSPRTWTVGSVATLAARIDKDLPEDTEWLTVDWGDGRLDRSVHRPGEPDAPGPIRFGDLSATAFTVHATHTYAAPGTYHGTVTVSDGFGQQTSLPFTETIEPKLAQTIAFADLPNRRIGETFDLSATGGGSANPVTFSSGASAVCVSSGDRGQTIELVGVGTCVIYASSTATPRTSGPLPRGRRSRSPRVRRRSRSSRGPGR